MGLTVMDEHTMVLDLETENMRLKDDLQKPGNYWWKKWQAASDAIQGWMNKWRNAEDNVIKLEALWRDHLDESDPADDNEWEAQMRQILWDESNTDKQIDTEGNDGDEVEPIPF